MTELELKIEGVSAALDNLESELDENNLMTDEVYDKLDGMVTGLGFIANYVESKSE